GTPADYLDSSLPFAAGGLAATVDDLARWREALDSGALLPTAAVADMLTPHVALCPRRGVPCPPPETTLGYGYGWYIGAQPSGAFQYHDGYLLGCKSLLAYYPQQNITVVVLSNLETTDTGAIRAAVEHLLLPT